jgi:hypothetical protein
VHAVHHEGHEEHEDVPGQTLAAGDFCQQSFAVFVSFGVESSWGVATCTLFTTKATKNTKTFRAKLSRPAISASKASRSS